MARKSNPILDILQTVATIKYTNITKAKMPADKDIIVCYLEYGRMQDLPREGNTFGVLDELSCCEGFGCILTVNFFKWCILKHIFITHLLKKILKIFIFYRKILINCSLVLAMGFRGMIHRYNLQYNTLQIVIY